MCNKAMCKNAAAFSLVPDQFKIQEMCILEVDPWHLGDVSDHFKTQEMCDKEVGDDAFSFQFVPDWFVT